MQVFLAVTPGELAEAMPFSRSFAHVAYRIGQSSTLLRQNLLLQTRGGLLAVSDREAPPIAEPEKLCAAVLRECGRRGYGGVLLDFEESPTPDRLAFVRQLGQVLSASRRTLYLPEPFAGETPAGVSLICTAISGGNFAERLREAAARRSPGRLALDVQRLRMDFRLPSRTGEGTPLTEAEFRLLLDREKPSVFFSQDLCARYFTYTREGTLHFVLFDDAGTLREKLKLGGSMGFAAAFLMWPEVRDIAGQMGLR